MYKDMSKVSKRHTQESGTNPFSQGGGKKPKPGTELINTDSNDAYKGADNFQIKKRGGNLSEYQKTMKSYGKDFLVSESDAAIGQKEGQFLGGAAGNTDSANPKTGKKGKWSHKQMMAGQNFDLGSY